MKLVEKKKKLFTTTLVQMDTVGSTAGGAAHGLISNVRIKAVELP